MAIWGKSIIIGQNNKPGTYITFSSPNAFTLKTNNGEKNWGGKLYYSTDLKKWNEWNGATTLSSGSNKKLYLRGLGNSKITGYYQLGRQWVLTGSNISCTGNIENLLDYKKVFVGKHPSMSIECYRYMFYNCTSLVAAPELPATELTQDCYNSMFRGCTSLTTAPELPATTLASYCYNYMFVDCTALTTAPKLPATTLKHNCYEHMFNGCTSLTTAPKLPATTLTTFCYANMFQGCTSLTTAPDLPATTLAEGCYYYMFQGCKSLTKASKLSATQLVYRCYLGMFAACKSLMTIPKLSATTLANYCYYDMFSGCTLIKLSTTKTGNYTTSYRIPITGTGTDATEALTSMFSGTGGTFTGTPTINTTYYTSNTIV